MESREFFANFQEIISLNCHTPSVIVDSRHKFVIGLDIKQDLVISEKRGFRKEAELFFIFIEDGDCAFVDKEQLEDGLLLLDYCY